MSINMIGMLLNYLLGFYSLSMKFLYFHACSLNFLQIAEVHPIHLSSFSFYTMDGNR